MVYVFCLAYWYCLFILCSRRYFSDDEGFPSSAGNDIYVESDHCCIVASVSTSATSCVSTILIARIVYSNHGGEIFLEGPVASLQFKIFLGRVKKIYKQNTLTISTILNVRVKSTKNLPIVYLQFFYLLL